MRYSISFGITEYIEAATYKKNLPFSHSIVYLLLVNNTGEVMSKIGKVDTGSWNEICYYASDMPFEWLQG